jgi:hypothetical protein
MEKTEKENNQEAIRYIFDIGWDCRLTPCLVEWLSKIMRKQYWKITPILFISDIAEEKEKDDNRTVYECGYWETPQSKGFKDRIMKKGSHQNLHQVIHCLNKYRGISLDKIEIEEWFYGSNQVDVRAKIDSEKNVVVELGSLSKPYSKFNLIYNPHVKEFWFDGKGKYFFALQANGELPFEDSFENTLLNFPKCICQRASYNCLVYSRPVYEACNYIRKNYQ